MSYSNSQVLIKGQEKLKAAILKYAEVVKPHFKSAADSDQTEFISKPGKLSREIRLSCGWHTIGSQVCDF